MAEDRMQRHLAAILAADVVGYTRLMEIDESDTFARLKAHRKEVFEPEIRSHNGRIFKLMGDGLLAEFGSVVDAVECAIVLQRHMTARNQGVANDRRIDTRIGISLGDIILDEEDCYSARLPVSGTVPHESPSDLTSRRPLRPRLSQFDQPLTGEDSLHRWMVPRSR